MENNKTKRILDKLEDIIKSKTPLTGKEHLIDEIEANVTKLENLYKK